MKILLLCNSLYQLIVACCIRNMFPQAEAEMILSDHSVGNKHIAEEFQKTGLIFNRVYYLETKFLYDKDAHLSGWLRTKEICDESTIPIMIDLTGNYDVFFCANAEPFSMRMVNHIKHMNKNATICWFEDGLTAYNFDKCYFPSNKEYIKKKMLEFFGIYDITTNVEYYYVFYPEKMEWSPRAQLIQIPLVTEKLREEMSAVFDLPNCPDKYSEKFIFFEDGARDWTNDDDIKIVEMIANIVGRENIFVRTHPRNPINRFKELGYKTNEDTSIPWEIISGNIDIENKVLLSIYSQCIITPEIVYGKKSQAISLAKLDTSLAELMRPLYEFTFKHYLSKDEGHYYVPESMEDLKSILMNIS